MSNARPPEMQALSTWLRRTGLPYALWIAAVAVGLWCTWHLLVHGPFGLGCLLGAATFAGAIIMKPHLNRTLDEPKLWVWFVWGCLPALLTCGPTMQAVDIRTMGGWLTVAAVWVASAVIIGALWKR